MKEWKREENENYYSGLYRVEVCLRGGHVKGRF